MSQCKTLINELAGQNSLHHNFITDPRIYAWSVGNEIDVGNPTTYSWCIQILDYIRADGGKAYISTPINSTVSSDWMTSIDLNYIDPAISGHVDYLSFNYYNAIYAAYNAQNAGTSVYTASLQRYDKRFNNILYQRKRKHTNV